MLLVLAVIRLAINDQLLPFGREIFEWHIQRDFKLAAHAQQVRLALGAQAGQPRFDHSLPQRPGPIRDGEVVINADHAAKPFAGGACAQGMIKAEERGGRLAILHIASGAVQPVAETHGLAGFLRAGPHRVKRQAAFAEVVSLLAGLGETRPVFRRNLQAILDNHQFRERARGRGRRKLVQADDAVSREQTLITLAGNKRERVLHGKFFRKRHGKSNDHFRAGMLLTNRSPD